MFHVSFFWVLFLQYLKGVKGIQSYEAHRPAADNYVSNNVAAVAIKKEPGTSSAAVDIEFPDRRLTLPVTSICSSAASAGSVSSCSTAVKHQMSVARNVSTAASASSDVTVASKETSTKPDTSEAHTTTCCPSTEQSSPLSPNSDHSPNGTQGALKNSKERRRRQMLSADQKKSLLCQVILSTNRSSYIIREWNFIRIQSIVSLSFIFVYIVYCIFYLPFIVFQSNGDKIYGKKISLLYIHFLIV